MKFHRKIHNNISDNFKLAILMCNGIIKWFQNVRQNLVNLTHGQGEEVRIGVIWSQPVGVQLT